MFVMFWHCNHEICSLSRMCFVTLFKRHLYPFDLSLHEIEYYFSFKSCFIQTKSSPTSVCNM